MGSTPATRTISFQPPVISLRRPLLFSRPKNGYRAPVVAVVKKLKTARFRDLVQTSGQPVIATLWTAPEEDAAFMKAVSENRVMTISQANVGTRKDFGVIGFHPRKTASYVVFPRRLKRPADTRVVGIRYEEFAEPELSGPAYAPKKSGQPRTSPRSVKPAKSKSAVSKKPPPAPKPTARLYTAEVSWQVVVVRQWEVRATNNREARTLLEQKARLEKIDFTKAAPIISVRNLRKK